MVQSSNRTVNRSDLDPKPMSCAVCQCGDICASWQNATIVAICHTGRSQAQAQQSRRLGGAAREWDHAKAADCVAFCGPVAIGTVI